MFATSTILTRLRAAGIHLLLSAAIFLVLLYFIVYQWYPIPYFSVDGGWQGIQIMIGVDLVLGPFLTLLIFNPNKTRNKILFDLGCIAVVQLSALIWGVSTVYDQRPVAISYWDGKFYSVTTKELKKQKLTPDVFEALSDQRPPVIYTRKPQTSEESIGVITWLFTESTSEWNLHFLHERISSHIEDVFRQSKDISAEYEKPEKLTQDFNLILERLGGKKEDYAAIPFMGRYGTVLLIMNKQGVIVDSLEI
ncbi:MAG: hypothetical protein AB1810_12210 [Pseudomonadota bacterium]